MTKRKFSSIQSRSKNEKIEEGEEVSALPFVRVSRRVTNRTPFSYDDIISSKEIRNISSENLLTGKRIINSFNAGDIEDIREIIFESASDNCETQFSNTQHIFFGKSALFSIWFALYEAFPNGIFRTSDSVINEKKQIFTSFIFLGTKIFPLLIDGIPLELLASRHDSFRTSTSSSSAAHTQYLLQTSSVIVDRDQALFTTPELLEMDTMPEMTFEGRMVVHLNEYCQIRKFDFVWYRKQ